MIKLILKGGLGNQMFQYAMAKALALRNDTDLYLDLSFLKTRIPFKSYIMPGFTYRNYDLDLYDVSDPKGTLFNNSILDSYFSYAFGLLDKRILNSTHYIAEGPNPYKFDSAIYNIPIECDVVVEGFWNNYKYFTDYETEIKNIFDMDKLYDSQFDEIENKIKSTPNSVSAHIRRGDYLNDKHKNVYVGLGAGYFKRAIQHMRSVLDQPHFFVFSQEDPEWFERELQLSKSEYTIVGKEYFGYKNSEHFRLMSLCANNIISNSTYSWWAAYLNKNANKVVVSPKQWMWQYSFENIPDWVSLDVIDGEGNLI